MKLLSCHIDNFGKLSGLDLDFTEGINLFHEPNAWGKSTLAAFLRVMFYGFDSKKESGSFDKERVVYRPWQGGVFGGELDFIYRDKTYRISRSFGKTEKTDEFHLYDLSTNLECHDFSSQIGSEIFGLDSASFKRSIFIAQNDCDCGSTDAINAKLGNLVENTNDINNFDTAQKKIHEKINRLSPDRATGSLKKRMNTMTLLTEELRSYDAAETASRELTEKLAQKQEQRKELSDIRSQYAKALQVASEESRRESLKQNYDALCQDENACKQTIDSYRNIFPDRVPEDSEFVQKNQEVQMLGVLKTTLHNLGLTEDEQAKYDKYSDSFSEGIPGEQQIADMEKELERLGKLREEKAQLETKISYFEAMAMQREEPDYTINERKPMLFAGIGLLLLGIIGGILVLFVQTPTVIEMFMPIVVVSLCAVAIGVALIAVRNVLVSGDERTVRAKKLKQMEEEEQLRKPVEEIQKTMEAATSESGRIEKKAKEFLGQYHINCEADKARSGLYELRNQIQEYERLKTRADKSDAAREEFDRTRDELLAFGRTSGIDFGEDIAAGLSQMQLKAAEWRLAQTSYMQAQQKKIAFEQKYHIHELAAIEKCPYSLDELNEMIHEVDERIEDVREAIEQYNHQLEDLQEQLDMRDEKAQQLSICMEEQEQEQQLYHTLCLTQDFLQNAKDQFSARYLGPIEGGFGKYYEILTQDHERNWMVDANIEVKLKEQGELRETKWLSAGYQDLVGICMRFALVDAMYPEEKPFLILDDPFVNLDEEKMERGNELLNQISKVYQILYFTCNASREVEEVSEEPAAEWQEEEPTVEWLEEEPVADMHEEAELAIGLVQQPIIDLAEEPEEPEEPVVEPWYISSNFTE
jgi:DNA repair exonuclease SbcCD ATPase subunit